ncbi:MAG TPA: hypothetical protein VFI29_07190 [Hanamia sp.]|nr:hypothetical protein [Hanamia sp.]
MENQIEIYKAKDSVIEVSVQFDNDTVWLSQRQMAELFGRNRVAITQHIGNIFKEGEFDEQVVCKEFLLTTQHGAMDGKTQATKTKYYNLEPRCYYFSWLSYEIHQRNPISSVAKKTHIRRLYVYTCFSI